MRGQERSPLALFFSFFLVNFLLALSFALNKISSRHDMGLNEGGCIESFWLRATNNKSGITLALASALALALAKHNRIMTTTTTSIETIARFKATSNVCSPSLSLFPDLSRLLSIYLLCRQNSN
ncbi:MAG: hypothetical protein J3R72DRAFT_459260 [Linnemannia gamsii]|nr:MAG: hypothetical protein J3R72DRAFT_459260 [Linnemannia gamsii]